MARVSWIVRVHKTQIWSERKHGQIWSKNDRESTKTRRRVSRPRTWRSRGTRMSRMRKSGSNSWSRINKGIMNPSDTFYVYCPIARSQKCSEHFNFAISTVTSLCCRSKTPKRVGPGEPRHPAFLIEVERTGTNDCPTLITCSYPWKVRQKLRCNACRPYRKLSS